MPVKPPRLCACGHRVAASIRCPCERKADQARKARFDRTRPNSSQRGYTGTWDKARTAFLAKHPRCRRCGNPATVVDHVTPHKGDTALFWDKSNWQSLCTPCHSGAKQSEERRNPRGYP
ncbi:HNH endonuclease signature motif containing protein [Tranquillimonas alkanivorans]|uniref:Putative HNH nuclease YajD n=1 Tax=Tranquillimonas alkanivorans TaxID=441119 RepID=A0A1I5RWA2_9RHOB|nr:HNH endonuclease [Tranquillimonas alkanivorans]SFP62795.1 5-methylcytosine-specific restriction endonuclease McrA [Tranquillimonas alkanivorans]